MARALLGQWDEAAADLHVASKLDYDVEIGLMLKKVIAETSLPWLISLYQQYAHSLINLEF